MKKILIIILTLLTLSVNADWRQYFYVTNKNNQFGSPIGTRDIVFLADSNTWYKITHIMQKTDSMATVFRLGYYVKIGVGTTELAAYAKLDSLAWYYYPSQNYAMQKNSADSLMLNRTIRFNDAIGSIGAFSADRTKYNSIDLYTFAGGITSLWSKYNDYENSIRMYATGLYNYMQFTDYGNSANTGGIKFSRTQIIPDTSSDLSLGSTTNRINDVFSDSLDATGGLKTGRDATIYGIRVGRGSGNQATNTALGASVLNANLSGGAGGLYNSAIGYESEYANTDGTRNTALGYQSLRGNTGGSGNTALGYQSQRVSSGGNSSYNTSIGYESLEAITSGNGNTAIGSSALTANTSGSNNTALGYQAGSAYTTISNRMFLGYNSDSIVKGIYGDMTIGKDWYRVNGTWLIKTLPVKSGTADSTIRPDYAHGGVLSMQVLPVTDSTKFPWMYSGGNTIQRAAGNVGIGTTNPDSTLHVSGNGKFTGGLRAGGLIRALSGVAFEGTGAMRWYKDGNNLSLYSDWTGLGQNYITVGNSTAPHIKLNAYSTTYGTSSTVDMLVSDNPVIGFDLNLTTRATSVIVDSNSLYSGSLGPGISKGINLGKDYVVDTYFPWDTTFTNNLKVSPDSLTGTGTALGIDGSGNLIKQEAADSTKNPWMYSAGNTVQRNDGNVGIGRTNPTAKLEINSLSASVPQFRTYKSGANEANPTDSLGLYVDSKGYCGVGTSAPTQALHVVGTSYASVKFEGPAFQGTSGGSYNSYDPNTMFLSGRDNFNFVIDPDNNGTNAFYWRSNNTGTSGTAMMTLLEPGNLGINTTNPTTKLQIAGKKAAALAISTDNDGLLGDSTAMYIDAGGKTGIGTTSPTAGMQVDVNGKTRTIGTVYAPTNTGDVAAGTGIRTTMFAADMRYNGSSATDITADPQIEDGYDGEEISIVGLSDENTLTLETGTGLALDGGTTMVIGLYDNIRLRYIASLDIWVEISRSKP